MKPTEGKIIEADVLADMSEASVEHACNKLVEAGTMPRVLQVSMDEDLDHARDVSFKNGITWLINSEFLGNEWAVHDLGEGEERITYWNNQW